VANRVFAIRLVQVLGWIFEIKKRKKERKTDKTVVSWFAKDALTEEYLSHMEDTILIQGLVAFLP